MSKCVILLRLRSRNSQKVRRVKILSWGVNIRAKNRLTLTGDRNLFSRDILISSTLGTESYERKF